MSRANSLIASIVFGALGAACSGTDARDDVGVALFSTQFMGEELSDEEADELEPAPAPFIIDSQCPTSAIEDIAGAVAAWNDEFERPHPVSIGDRPNIVCKDTLPPIEGYPENYVTAARYVGGENRRIEFAMDVISKYRQPTRCLALHELGHWHGARDVDDESRLMHLAPASGACEITADDILSVTS